MNSHSALSGAAAFLNHTSPDTPSAVALVQRQEDRVRLRVSRRRFIGQAAGAAGVIVGASALFPRLAAADSTKIAAPRPVPYGINIGGVDFSLSFFGPSTIPGVIGDFNGFVGVADVQRTGRRVTRQSAILS